MGHVKTVIGEYRYGEIVYCGDMRASVVMRSTEVGKCAARPWEDLHIAWSAERIREKLRRHLNQHRVLLYGVSHFCESSAARRL